MTEPCDLSAVDALTEIQSGALSPVELFQSCVIRIETVNPVLNAIVASDLEAGLTCAQQVTDKISRGEEIGLLGGLPTGIKDLEGTAGLRTTWGSKLHENEVPEEDDFVVANIRSHDANIFCKTNTPEFGAGGNTVNLVYGATGNPFDASLTCAGSSGGTAVALATGMLPVATGSDYGGSLRTPASFCGITGFRPSPGVVPAVQSTVALSPFAVIGPMGRTVADTHLLLKAQSIFDRRDPYSSSQLQIPDELESIDLSTIRAAWSVDFGCCPIDTEIAALFKNRVSIFASHFASCDERNPVMDNVHNVFEVLRGLFFVAAHEQHLKHNRDLLGANVIDNTERGLSFTASQISQAFAQQSEIYRDALDYFKDTDILIAPAAAVSPFPHTQRTVTRINGEDMPTYMRWLALSYAPTTALCCSCVLPCGLNNLGLPFGIQVIGPNGSDAKVLAVAAALETILATNTETKRPVPDIEAIAAAV